jgi:uncharacterized protein YdeI (YjbR/CyaY-like superfamily)
MWIAMPRNCDGVGHIAANRSAMAAAGVDAPQRVQVTPAPDTKPRTVDVACNLGTALAHAAASKAASAALSFMHKREREYARRIVEATRPETRERRIARTVERMEQGEAPR